MLIIENWGEILQQTEVNRSFNMFLYPSANL
jgi:hypothetical protein